MTPLRLVLVTGRFWPLAADQQRLLADLAEELAGEGLKVTVLTAQGHKSWPPMISFRRIPVVRLPRSNTRVWGAFRYQRALSQWLAEHRRQFDLVYVVGMRDEAQAALSTASHAKFPVVLRSVGLGESGDCHWLKSVHFGGRMASRCRTADAVIAPNAVAVEELQQAGFPGNRIQHIADGVPPRRRNDGAWRQRSRADLADVHPVLVVPQDSPLVLYSGPIRENPALLDLVAAWPTVLERWPSARLWLAGDASGADVLWNEIQQADLTDSVILPGSFDHFDEILSAVNVYVHPTRESTPSRTMLEAMASGVPVVASRTPLTVSLLDADDDALLTPPGDHAALADAIVRLLAEPELADRLAEAAWRKSSQRHTIGKMAERHLSLFRRLVSPRIPALS